jgi:type II secretory pathway component PulM
VIEDLFSRLLGGPRDRFAAFLAGREPRERVLLFVGAGAAALLVLWLGVWEPLAGQLDRLDRSIAAARRDQGEIARLKARHEELSAQVQDLERRVGGSEGGASLFAQLESVAVPIVGRERIAAMSPQTRAVGDRFEEESVDVRIDGVPIRELVKLLHEIEDGSPPMEVSRASFKRQYKDATRLDVSLVVSRLKPK